MLSLKQARNIARHIAASLVQISKCPLPDVPTNPRTRLIIDEPLWKGYEVLLDVWEDVFVYGILLLPNDLQLGEQLPAVVCQHGLGGRSQDTADPRIESVYHAYAAQLADREFVVYAPQNPYISQDAFRVIQTKGKSGKMVALFVDCPSS